jgi:hypothetical protein
MALAATELVVGFAEEYQNETQDKNRIFHNYIFPVWDYFFYKERNRLGATEYV